jgi:hypothetical protein
MKFIDLEGNVTETTETMEEAFRKTRFGRFENVVKSLKILTEELEKVKKEVLLLGDEFFGIEESISLEKIAEFAGGRNPTDWGEIAAGQQPRSHKISEVEQKIEKMQRDLRKLNEKHRNLTKAEAQAREKQR